MGIRYRSTATIVEFVHLRRATCVRISRLDSAWSPYLNIALFPMGMGNHRSQGKITPGEGQALPATASARICHSNYLPCDMVFDQLDQALRQSTSIGLFISSLLLELIQAGITCAAHPGQTRPGREFPQLRFSLAPQQVIHASLSKIVPRILRQLKFSALLD